MASPNLGNKIKSVADIGTGSGRLAIEFDRKFKNVNKYILVEPNQNCLHYAADQLLQHTSAQVHATQMRVGEDLPILKGADLILCNPAWDSQRPELLNMFV